MSRTAFNCPLLDLVPGIVPGVGRGGGISILDQYVRSRSSWAATRVRSSGVIDRPCRVRPTLAAGRSGPRVEFPREQDCSACVFHAGLFHSGHEARWPRNQRESVPGPTRIRGQPLPRRPGARRSPREAASLNSTFGASLERFQKRATSRAGPRSRRAELQQASSSRREGNRGRTGPWQPRRVSGRLWAAAAVWAVTAGVARSARGSRPPEGREQARTPMVKIREVDREPGMTNVLGIAKHLDPPNKGAT